ncbi:hypothetical protein [Syntrophomonas palmitatica]|uniref:hypothetical protein n=1 Tax=Syntrophomonas palmitatica TaxID=402877 RepID=UPI000AB764B7
MNDRRREQKEEKRRKLKVLYNGEIIALNNMDKNGKNIFSAAKYIFRAAVMRVCEDRI